MAGEEANYGVAVERSADGIAWARVPRVKGAVTPRKQRTYRDITDLDSNGDREFFRTLTEFQPFKLDCTMTEAGLTAWLADEAAGLTYYRFTLPGGTAYTGQAYVDINVNSDDLEGEAMIEVQVRPSGAWSLAVA